MAATIRVLHVDDEPDFAEMAAAFIEREEDQITVETARSASEGLDRLGDERFDCVVSDYDMPGTDGIEFLEAIRADHPDLPFILFTGKGSEEIASEAISTGVTEYMQKEHGTDQYTVLANRIVNSVNQYRAEQEAEQTKQRLREITQSTTDCRWMFTSDWDELLFISGYEEVWSRSTEAIKDNPQDFLNNVHPDDRELVKEGMGRLSDGESADLEYRILRGDDSIGWVWAKGEPVFGDDGEVVRIVGLTRDITDRKAREQELERTTERMEFVLRNLNSGICELDTETRTITSYPDPCPIFQREFETFDDFTEMIHPDDRSHVETAAQTALESEEAVSIEFRPIDEVDIEWIQCEIKPVLDDDGSIAVLTGLTRDVTERKRHEQQLQHQNERLDEFASIVSHDLQSPLNVAEGRLELAQEDCDNEHLDAVADAIERCQVLVDDLLTLAREGDRVSNQEPVELAALSEACWQTIETADATLVTTTDRTIRADRSRFRQLLENLLGNAVEHGGEDVTITVGTVADESGFYVEDDGRGIPEDKRDQVFESSYSTSEAGTGLGLAIVAEIAEAHGWDVTVTEGSDGGARFEITDVTFEG